MVAVTWVSGGRPALMERSLPESGRAIRLAWRFLLPAVAAVFGTLLLAVPWLVWTLDQDQIATLVVRLDGETREGGAVLPWTSGTELDRAAAALADRIGARVTIIAPDGAVLGESTPHPTALESHRDRPEVQAALQTGSGHAVRWSATLDRRLLYAARLDERDGERRIIRVAVPISSVSEHLLRLRAPIATALATAIALGLGVAWLVSSAMRRRLQRTGRFRRGTRGGTACAAHGSAAEGRPGRARGPARRDGAQRPRDDRRLRVERERLEAILRGMVEGVLVTDLDGARRPAERPRTRAARAAARRVGRAAGPLVELARDPALGELTRELAAGDAVASRDVTLSAGDRAARCR